MLRKNPSQIWRRVFFFFFSVYVFERILEAPTQCHRDKFKARLMADVDTPWCFLDDSMMPCEPVIFRLGECEGRVTVGSLASNKKPFLRSVEGSCAEAQLCFDSCYKDRNRNICGSFCGFPQNGPVETDDFLRHQELISAQEEANEQKDHREQDLLQLHRACEASLEGQAFACKNHTTPPPFWFIHSDVCKCSCRTALGILRGSLQEFWGATCQFYSTSLRPYPWGCGELRAYSFERKYGATRWTKIDFRWRPPSTSQSELCRWIGSFQFFIFVPWSAGSPQL